MEEVRHEGRGETEFASRSYVQNKPYTSPEMEKTLT